ncbi:hypothetical protein HZB00_02765 [Candidatus Woesearchaeota archaeon]|nr:hypothetical protein [Candidatus Woesearchaeota archaeon]
MNPNAKTLGSVLVGFAIILLFLLTFIKIDDDKKSTVLCDQFKGNMEQCPVHKSSFSWMIIVAYGIGFIVLVLGFYLLFSHKLENHEPKKEFKPVAIDKLDPEEKVVYAFVQGKEGSAYQSDLIKETHFSKVKMTRILDKMELKGILERKRRGMTNIIVLK